MDIDKNYSLHGYYSGKGKKGDTGRLAAQLAPPEEQASATAAQQIEGDPSSSLGQSDQDYGAIVFDNNDVSLAKDIMEAQAEKTFLGMEPVVLVIVGVMLTFIAFIAWQISRMPVE